MVGPMDHVAVVVRDLERSIEMYRDTLGFRLLGVEEVASEGVRVAFLEPEGSGTKIELLEPLGADSPVSSFLEKRGEGVHHLCFLTKDIVRAMEEIRGRGLRALSEAPRQGAHGASIFFIHPRDTAGVLIEIKAPGDGAEPSSPEPERAGSLL